MIGAAWDPRNWTHEQIEDECRKPYRAYHRELRARHVLYYTERPEQRSLNEKRPFEAATLADAFPPGYEQLAVSEIGWHTHARSAGSSQVLLLALLAPAIEADPALQWLWRVPSAMLTPVGAVQSSRFE